MSTQTAITYIVEAMTALDRALRELGASGGHVTPEGKTAQQLEAEALANASGALASRPPSIGGGDFGLEASGEFDGGIAGKK